ncbi:MAG: FAD-dependent oxidoreductase [Pseudomonadota bacterium]
MANIPGIPVWREVGTTPLPASQDDTAPICIVGGGPVGLALALDLGRKGQSVTVLNKMDFVANCSKAICFSKRSLDILDRLGAGQKAIEKGVIWDTGKVFWGDKEDPIYQFDMLPVKDQKNPGFINLQQYYMEEFLLDALEAYPNVDIRWGHEVTGLEQRNDGVRLSVNTKDGAYTLSAAWLAACDGVKSAIREMMGLDFEGRVFEDNFLIADVKFKEERPSERWFWFDPPFFDGQSALLHKQPDDVWRCDFQLGWDVDREACIKPENVEPLVRGMFGSDIDFEEEWYSVYTFQCRRMARFVHGRVIFAGDAAHLVSPFGARGCNGGFADIDNLAWKLDAVVRGDAPENLLETYNTEAIITADENILNSTRSTDFMTPKTKTSHAFRDAVLELANAHEFARPFVNSGRLSTPVSYPTGPLNTADVDDWAGQGVAPGSPPVDAPLGDKWLMDALGDDFVLLGHTLPNGLPNGTIKHVDVSGHDQAIKRYGLQPGSAVLLRPDQYVAARWKAASSQGVETAHKKAMGTLQ